MDKNVNIWEVTDKRISRQTFIRFQSIFSSLKTAEKKAANFMLAHPDKLESTITDFAEMAGCSEATLVRIAKKLTYSGYPELRAAIMRQEGESEVYYDDISDQDSVVEVIHKVFRASIRSIEDSLDMLDMPSYSKAIEALNSAAKILFIGNGDALPVAMSGFLKFSRIGVDAAFSCDFDTQLVQASRLSQGDVVIAISHSGCTCNMLNVVKQAKACKATVIAVTNFPVSPLAKHADIILLTAAFLQNAMGEVMTKRLPELCIIENMYISLARMNPVRTAKMLEQSSIALEFNKL